MSRLCLLALLALLAAVALAVMPSVTKKSYNYRDAKVLRSPTTHVRTRPWNSLWRRLDRMLRRPGRSSGMLSWMCPLAALPLASFLFLSGLPLNQSRAFSMLNSTRTSTASTARVRDTSSGLVFRPLLCRELLFTLLRCLFEYDTMRPRLSLSAVRLPRPARLQRRHPWREHDVSMHQDYRLRALLYAHFLIVAVLNTISGLC